MNYILPNEKLCMVCESEVKGVVDEDNDEYCPFCGIRKLNGQEMCDECRLEWNMNYRQPN
ncbi:MAG: hypothetical protein PHX51_01090 [Clostridia bacterium]|nr:hypothetical protein [Clostridia bacterium]